MTITACLQDLLRFSAPAYQLLPSASDAALQELGRTLPVGVPAELLELYQLSNGVAECISEDQSIPPSYLLLPAEEAAEENKRIRQRPQTRKEASLLIVARAYVDGILFGYSLADLPAASAAVYAWRPIDDEVERMAESLPAFLVGWASGQIKV